MTDTVAIPCTLQFPTQRLYDILTTAREGGCDYWAAMNKSVRDDELNVLSFQARDHEDEDSEWMTVDKDTVIKGITTLCADPKWCKMRIVSEILKGDEGDLDADDCDVIIQVGLFGELVYG